MTSWLTSTALALETWVELSILVKATIILLMGLAGYRSAVARGRQCGIFYSPSHSRQYLLSPWSLRALQL